MQVLTYVKDIFFPSTCVSCFQPCLGQINFCVDCFKQLSFVPVEKCPSCGIASDRGEMCVMCQYHPLAFDKLHAVVRYNEFISRLIFRFKFYDQLHMGPVLAKMMSAEIPVKEKMVVVPVPLHWRRRLWRRYNQSAELGRYIARMGKMDYEPCWVERHIRTQTQMRLKGRQRRKNLQGAFRFHPKLAQKLQIKYAPKDYRILLVDDVLTTGTTLQSVARLFKDQGYKVEGVVFARVDGHIH